MDSICHWDFNTGLFCYNFNRVDRMTYLVTPLCPLYKLNSIPRKLACSVLLLFAESLNNAFYPRFCLSCVLLQILLTVSSGKHTYYQHCSSLPTLVIQIRRNLLCGIISDVETAIFAKN